MQNVTLKAIRTCVVIVSICATASAFAQGGNGNGGSGGGGSHGAATSGMTYHSEPITSPWGKDPGRMAASTGTPDTAMHTMSSDDGSMPAKTAQ